MLKQNKGITLVALVITIIVLLILAGVSISLVVGDNGVLTQAKTSSDKTKISQFREALGIAINDVQTAYFANYANKATTTFNSEINYGTLNEALKRQGYKLQYLNGSNWADANSNTGYFSNGNTEVFRITANQSTATDKLYFKISRPSGTNGIGIKTVFSTKLNSNGDYETE